MMRQPVHTQPEREQQIIEVSSVSKTFVDKHGQSFLHKKREWKYTEAVKDVSFIIRRGEMVGLTGPNGAGKSTILRLLSGILAPDAGAIRVAGFEPGRERKEYVRRIGLLLAGKSQITRGISINEALEWHGRFYGIQGSVLRERLAFFSDLLELEGVFGKTSEELSLGEQMKLKLTLVFLHNPKIVFLDEPTIGVDVIAKESIRHFLLQMNRTGNLTMILTSHDENDVKTLCNRELCLEQGRLVEDRKVQMP